MEGYRREDPATAKQMAVPVRAPNHVFTNTRAIKDPRHKAIGELVLIAFYFYYMWGNTHITTLSATHSSFSWEI